jgi:hypothetical protein
MSQADIIPDEPSRSAILEHGRELEIAALKGSPALKVLIEALQQAEQEWALRVGFNVLTSVKEVDQRKLDWTRGYFAGARFWLQERVSIAEQRVATHVAKQAGQTDLRPTGEPDPRVQRSEDA